MTWFHYGAFSDLYALSNVTALKVKQRFQTKPGGLTSTSSCFIIKKNSKSLDYVMSVDLWSDTIAMDYPSPHILRL